MHSNRRNVNNWNRHTKLRKNSLASEKSESEDQSILSVDSLEPHVIRVVKLDGTVQIIKVKKQQ
jgi:hypothetical protein